MNNERKTQTIEVGEHTIEMYTFVNTLENRKLTEILTKNAVIGADGQVSSGFTIADLFCAQDYIITAMVVSFDGVKENICDAILSLQKDEGDAVHNAINTALNLDIGTKKK